MRTPRLANLVSLLVRAARAGKRRQVALGASLAGSFAALTLGLSSCNLHNPGVDPPDVALSYPMSLALSREVRPGQGPKFLYVANTNYDLRYNGATVQAFNLDELARTLGQRGCATFDKPALTGDGSVSFTDNTTYPMSLLDAGPLPSDASAPDAGPALGGMDASAMLPPGYTLPGRFDSVRGTLCDGRDPVERQVCCLGPEDLKPAEGSNEPKLLHSHVVIDSYAAGIAVAPDDRRIYVPVGSRSTLVYLDVDQGQLSCGGPGRCRRGPNLDSGDDDPSGNFPGQPAWMAIGQLRDLGVDTAQGEGITPDATFLATAHALGGFGLFVEKNGVPVLEAVATGLAQRPTSLTVDPREKLLYVTANQQPYIARLGVRISPDPLPASLGQEPGPRELLYQTRQIFINDVSQPRDVRDVVFAPDDPARPDAPRRLYALIRGSQESVAFLELDRTDAASGARLLDAVRVGDGPSKLTYVQQDGRDFVLVSCYDARQIDVIDVESRKVTSVIRNLSGPFQMVHDPVRQLLYVTDFRVSVLRVIDLAGLTRKDKPPPRIIATLGNPEFEGGLE